MLVSAFLLAYRCTLNVACVPGGVDVDMFRGCSVVICLGVELTLQVHISVVHQPSSLPRGICCAFIVHLCFLENNGGRVIVFVPSSFTCGVTCILVLEHSVVS